MFTTPGSFWRLTATIGECGRFITLRSTTAIVFTSDPYDITHLGAAAETKPGLVVRRV